MQIYSVDYEGKKPADMLHTTSGFDILIIGRTSCLLNYVDASENKHWHDYLT